MGEVFSLAPVHFADLLQAHNIGVQLLDGMAQVVDLQAARRAQALDTFVDVVSRNPYQCHALPLFT